MSAHWFVLLGDADEEGRPGRDCGVWHSVASPGPLSPRPPTDSDIAASVPSLWGQVRLLRPYQLDDAALCTGGFILEPGRTSDIETPAMSLP